MTNPFLNLNYETALESLGKDYYHPVTAAEFPAHILRFRNNELLPILGLNPKLVKDEDFIEAFGKFQSIRPFLALCYHGYQFGQYNPNLGDGRGFLYGQVRGIDNNLYDFGTKGSGQTPYSRFADGRLTLKGGVREVLAGEALHQLGVNTSRTLSLIETGESLWRGDEPSPTRSCVMIRFSRSHIRFGSFERLHYLKRPDLIEKLLNHVIYYYYPNIDVENKDCYAMFYAELVERVAKLTAQWMSSGFCHGVLNTDNMSITGESFDYGPYAFIPDYNFDFTAAYFDYAKRYCYGHQPLMCKLNLEMLQIPLKMVMSPEDLESGLIHFDHLYKDYYHQLMMKKLGIINLEIPETKDLLKETTNLLKESSISYHDFFAELAKSFNHGWLEDSSTILENVPLNSSNLEKWQNLYHQVLTQLPPENKEKIGNILRDSNPQTALLRPVIESVWEAIAYEDNWQPFQELLTKIRKKE